MAEIEFLEWTGADHLRHTTFVGLRDDKDPRSVVRETEMALERYELHGVKVYQLNICEAIGDHPLCPGITTLKAGDFDLGTVACNCACHRKSEDERAS